MKIDCHVHSIFSDGKYTIEELIALYSESNLDGFILTDHDSIDGLDYLESLDINSSLKVLPGVELSCSYKGEDVHILGLGLDVSNKKIRCFFDGLKEERRKRANRIIDLLMENGIEINGASVYRENAPGRPHIARELVYGGYAEDIREAFSKYLYDGSKYYVAKKKLDIEEGIEVLKESGAKTVLAHGGLLKNKKEIIDRCIESGIDGLEVYHPKHNKFMETKLLEIGRTNELIVTGGSDLHYNKADIGRYYIDKLDL